jgi:hypothetical protein
MRVWSEKACGIPPEQVAGSSGVTEQLEHLGAGAATATGGSQ